VLLEFHRLAEREVSQQYAYNLSIQPPLADRFMVELERIFDSIATYPHSGSPSTNSSRFRILRRFPFMVVYVVRTNSIEVLALAHTRRRPGYWRRRVNNA
jgi:plasmid stabilization system protein ParE